ncbi:hypothetical protein [Stenotrophomonas lactitubi]|uniref:hypothetical protein n=1 Tax=Stenotrophomonas lactitubi TaxID=2045214 RepID=UPI003340F9A8
MHGLVGATVSRPMTPWAPDLTPPSKEQRSRKLNKSAPFSAGIRYRELGQCRHTYASQLLTTGIASSVWIAEQMGHTNGNMIRQHYGTWINEDGPDVVGMLQLALKLSPVTVLH